MMPHRSVRHRLSDSDTWLLELFLALYTVVWGAWFANPWLDSFSGAISYTLIAQFPGGEAVFGACVAALGVSALLATLYGSRQTRAVLFGVAGAFWVAVTVAIGVPTGWSAGGISHFILAVLGHWFLWARLRYRGVV